VPLPWIKMWLEGLDDPKLTRLSLAEGGAWWGLLMLAGKCAAGGKIVSGGAGLDVDEIADALHIKTNDDRQALESMLAKMEKRGSLTWNDNVLVVVHYEKRQRVPPSSQPAAVAERVRQYRDRRKKGNKIHKLCRSCGYKGLTAEDNCPKCGEKLERDYEAGKDSHMIKR